MSYLPRGLLPWRRKSNSIAVYDPAQSPFRPGLWTSELAVYKGKVVARSAVTPHQTSCVHVCASHCLRLISQKQLQSIVPPSVCQWYQASPRHPPLRATKIPRAIRSLPIRFDSSQRNMSLWTMYNFRSEVWSGMVLLPVEINREGIPLSNCSVHDPPSPQPFPPNPPPSPA